MITKKQVKECKDIAKKKGFVVSDTDIAYITMCKTFEDKEMVYTLLFRECKQLPLREYDTSDKIAYLRNYISDLIKKNRQHKTSHADVKNISEAISFEENREGMEAMLKKIEELKTDSEIPVKELVQLLKAEADVRTKLNDKFNIKEQFVEQRIIVQPKFNHICDYTQKECWLQTKKFAMEYWHLIDDPNYK